MDYETTTTTGTGKAKTMKTRTGTTRDGKAIVQAVEEIEQMITNRKQLEAQALASELKPWNSSIRPGDAFTVPLRVVLLRSIGPAGEWVTRLQNMQDGSQFWGHYYPAIAEKGGEVGAFRRAFRDYVKRCHEHLVDPCPAQGIQDIPPGVARPGQLRAA